MSKVGPTLIVALLIGAAAPPGPACTVTAGMAVDADGAPDSYLVDGRGLSYTCDGVFAIVGGVAHTQLNDAKNWQTLCASHWTAAKQSGDYSGVKIVGFIQDGRGKPIVQGEGNPLPGKAFVTTTKLTVPGTPATSQRHFVDAVQIPYVVLPGDWAANRGVSLGGVVAVYRPKTGRMAFAVYGDCCSIGEGSVRLHQDIGANPLVTKRDGTKRAKQGIEDRVVFVPFRGAGTTPTLDAAAWRKQIQEVGTAALDRFGGIAAIKACSGT